MKATETDGHDKFAVITGASSGIGLELAKLCADHHFDLLVVAEDDEIFSVAEDLKRYGASVDALQEDLASVGGNENLCNYIKSIGRGVDALLINAGIGVHGNFILDNDVQDHLKLINLNIVSPVYLTKIIGKQMLVRGQGKILFTSSIASLMPGTFMATYNASKSFVESFAQAIREELKDTPITVTTLLPGPTDTKFFERAEMLDTKVGAGKKDDASDVAKAGFAAMMKGEEHVVGGSFANKVQEVISKVLPDNVKAKLHAQQAAPGSGQRS